MVLGFRRKIKGQILCAIFGQEMAAGNAESEANGVTGMGCVHRKPVYFAIQT